MPIFALKDINGLSREAQLKFKQLAIKKSLNDDATGQLDEFEEVIKTTTFKGEYIGFLSYIEHWSQNINRKPPGKFKKLATKKGKETEYEYKSDNLRIYLAFIKGQGIVIFGELKKPSRQDNHIQHFRNLKESYLQQVK